MKQKYIIYYYTQFYSVQQLCVYATSCFNAREIAQQEMQYLKMFPNRIYSIQIA